MQIEHNASRSSDGISIKAGQHADDVSVEVEHRRHRGRGGVSPRRSRQRHDGAGAGSADLNHELESNLKPETVERKRNRAVFLKTVAIFFFHNLYNILNFDEFCRTHSFKIFNSILTKNLEIDSSF
jgi:hypothetical protein